MVVAHLSDTDLDGMVFHQRARDLGAYCPDPDLAPVADRRHGPVDPVSCIPDITVMPAPHKPLSVRLFRAAVLVAGVAAIAWRILA